MANWVMHKGGERGTEKFFVLEEERKILEYNKNLDLIYATFLASPKNKAL